MLAVRRLLRAKHSAENVHPNRQETKNGLAAQVDALVEFYGQPSVDGPKTVEQCRSIILKRIGVAQHGTDAENAGLKQTEWLALCAKLQAKYPSAKPLSAVSARHQTKAGSGDEESKRTPVADCRTLVVREEDALAAIGVVRPSSMREVALEIPSGKTQEATKQ